MKLDDLDLYKDKYNVDDNNKNNKRAELFKNKLARQDIFSVLLIISIFIMVFASYIWLFYTVEKGSKINYNGKANIELNNIDAINVDTHLLELNSRNVILPTKAAKLSEDGRKVILYDGHLELDTVVLDKLFWATNYCIVPVGEYEILGSSMNATLFKITDGYVLFKDCYYYLNGTFNVLIGTNMADYNFMNIGYTHTRIDTLDTTKKTIENIIGTDGNRPGNHNFLIDGLTALEFKGDGSITFLKDTGVEYEYHYSTSDSSRTYRKDLIIRKGETLAKDWATYFSINAYN